jgi:hypothetical protein
MHVRKRTHTHTCTHTHTHTGEEEEEKEASLPQQATLNGAGVDDEDASMELGSEGVRGEELLKLVAGVVTSSFLISRARARARTHTHTHKPQNSDNGGWKQQPRYSKIRWLYSVIIASALSRFRVRGLVRVQGLVVALICDNRWRIVEVRHVDVCVGVLVCGCVSAR